MPTTTTIGTQTQCYHCGEDLRGSKLRIDDKPFCCDGCKMVYEILSENQLADYYRYNETPGATRKGKSADRFDYLDHPGVAEKLLRFQEGNLAAVTLRLPQIHCSSCIWLLENLWRLNPGVHRVQVHFYKREAFILFDPKVVSLRQLAELLEKIGYTPDIRLESLDQKKTSSGLRPYWMRLGVAFFCFGNIMLLSFPEYFGVDALAESSYRKLFGYLNFALSLPVLLYSSSMFFRSAWAGLREKQVNLDVPIVLGILVMFFRSSWEIFSQTGSGYMDTLSSLVFLMLIGRLFQQKTYDLFSFDRDYTSYFPAASTVLKNGKETSVPLSELKTGDRLLIRNGELIPADGLLFSGEASVDYSFVTGEAEPIHKTLGELLYAGGRQAGGAIEIEIVRPVSQSYLVQLWNDAAFRKDESRGVTSLAQRVSKTFTFVVLAIAFGAGLFWLRSDVHAALNAFTAVLIITCPCALALSSPFTLGRILRILGRNGIYLKSAPVIETLARANHIVFDKTGTITQSGENIVRWDGVELTDSEKSILFGIARQSSHPLSRSIAAFAGPGSDCAISDFREITGKGISAVAGTVPVLIGSASFTEAEKPMQASQDETAVYVRIGDQIRGRFLFRNQYREGVDSMVNELKQDGCALSLISGDGEGEKPYLEKMFGANTDLYFRQSPSDKLRYLQDLREQGKITVMVGDGLNDAGALRGSDAGLAISDNVNNFSPACDGIIEASMMPRIPQLLRFARSGVNIIRMSFALSFLYNIVGVFFAVQGSLSPLIAAILMPVSSATIMLFTTIAATIAGKRKGF